VIVYLDASALVKRYVAEAGSVEVDQLIAGADLIGTAMISRAEVAAALAKATRMSVLPRDEARTALHLFRIQWPDLVRLQLTETILSQADALAWEYGLRGYDAVHLAAACFWQSSLREPVALATFDRQLWEASALAGVRAWPEDLNRHLGRQ
jgi:predicted nucleic acid-binding protein